jgi:hypothetical protein
MKITALIPDKLVQDVKKLANGKNLTESLTIALREWTAQQKIKRLNTRIAKKPLSFYKDFSAAKIRSINRQQ